MLAAAHIKLEVSDDVPAGPAAEPLHPLIKTEPLYPQYPQNYHLPRLLYAPPPTPPSSEPGSPGALLPRRTPPPPYHHTAKYNRRNNPELEKRRIHHCDFIGQCALSISY